VNQNNTLEYTYESLIWCDQWIKTTL